MSSILLLIKPAERFAVYVCYKYNPPLLPCRNFFLFSTRIYTLSLPGSSSPLTPPQSHRLSIFLQLRNQPVSLLDHVGVLLVLVIRPVRFYNLVDAIDGAGDAVRRDEFG